MNAKTCRPATGRLVFAGCSRAALWGFSADGEWRVSRRGALWFQNRRYSRSTIETRHQPKIYEPTDRSIFSQIFAELSLMQSLGLYPRPLVSSIVETTEPRDVFYSSPDILARAGARAAAAGKDARIGEATADRRLRGCAGCHCGGFRHEPVLQTPAGRL